jgi:hypothetical protein
LKSLGRSLAVVVCSAVFATSWAQAGGLKQLNINTIGKVLIPVRSNGAIERDIALLGVAPRQNNTAKPVFRPGVGDLMAQREGDVTAQRAPGSRPLDTINAVSPPLLSIAFGTSVIAPNNDTTLTFTIQNPNLQVLLDGIGFLDNLPLGLVISTSDTGSQDCGGGVISAPPGSGTISLSGATLTGGASCQFSVTVTGIALGVQLNLTSAIGSNETSTGPAAAASITVQFDDAYQVSYAVNLGTGDSFIDMTNAGSDPGGKICANVYTFNPAQSLISCCSCMIGPNELRSLSAQRDLISNPLIPGVPTSVIIKLVASQPVNGTCNAAYPSTASLTQGLRAWSTTLHTTPFGLANGENAFQPSYLNPNSLAEMVLLCQFIQGNGSGFGICRSCQLGGLGGLKR